jgi:polyvinyl alcohol dehydrogenase (cytochrome)
MKKIAIILIVSVVAFFSLGGRTLLQDPAATIEAFVVRHADVLPLEMLGNSLFDKHCASCHDNPAMHAPTRQSLAGFSKESVMIAMEFGKMQPMAAHLSKQERGLIAMYLSGADTQSYTWLDAARCDKAVRDDIASGDKEEYVGNWGLGKNNQRFASNKTAGITKDNVATLELAWSFAFPKVTDMRSQPVIIGDTMYVGDKAKKLYAIDRKSGCVLRETDFIAGAKKASPC